MLLLFRSAIGVLKFLFATSIAFLAATVLELFLHYQLLSWLFVFCLCFYLVFYIIKTLTPSVFFIALGLTIISLFFLYHYANVAGNV
ncbi:MAG: hypothetical protein HAW63_00045 [Bdellovibrionaceae bacterium]|nr:hypothetical protein [Pseudobdellovibrionaceae bacterium]